MNNILKYAVYLRLFIIIMGNMHKGTPKPKNVNNQQETINNCF